MHAQGIGAALSLSQFGCMASINRRTGKRIVGNTGDLIVIKRMRMMEGRKINGIWKAGDNPPTPFEGGG